MRFSAPFAKGRSRRPGEPPPTVPREPEPRAPVGHAPDSTLPGRRDVVAEPCPRSRAAVEHALLGEGYELVSGEPEPSEEPVLLLAGDGEGLHVLAARDVAGALARLSGGTGAVAGPPAAGIHAFVPKPFGAADVLRVARAVDGFDCRRRRPPER